jgi:outer membrane immunogenic protein
VSASAYGLFAPDVYGTAIQQKTSKTVGFLGSYRYMLTPRSALEVNYSFAQGYQYYKTSFLTGKVHQRQQEISGAYVYSRNYRKYSPFVEVGVGGLLFTPIQDYGSTSLDTKQTTNIGGLFGGGLAYELSPSFDIRAEYRAFVVKAPYFGLDAFKTNQYEVISMPALGVAYHF